jgi:hypothetical protein
MICIYFGILFTEMLFEQISLNKNTTLGRSHFFNKNKGNLAKPPLFFPFPLFHQTTTKSANQRLPPRDLRLPLNKTVVVSLFIHLVGYCLENDTVAGSWCALVRAQQAAGSRQRAGEPS